MPFKPKPLQNRASERFLRLGSVGCAIRPQQGIVMSILQRILRPTVLMGATLGLSACMYADGAYGDGYVNGGYSDGYACDPYDPYDAYYSCDYGYGFANIGFGGGWYDDFFYPGYGLFVFDRIGHRHQMRNNHRRYWAHRRHQHGQQHVRRGNRESRHANRVRNLSPEQRTERRERRAERLRDLTPEQRAERRERRAERRENRRDGGAVRNGAAMSQQDLQHRNRESRREIRRGNRQNSVSRSTRRGNSTAVRQSRSTAATEQPRRARPAARQPSQRQVTTRRSPATKAPVERASTVRSSRTGSARRQRISDQ